MTAVENGDGLAALSAIHEDAVASLTTIIDDLTQFAADQNAEAETADADDDADDDDK